MDTSGLPWTVEEIAILVIIVILLAGLLAFIYFNT